MVKKQTTWGNVTTRCPHCKGRIRVYVRDTVEVAKHSGYITGPKKAKKTRK